jgi:putative FmdB family regulatory protein
MPIYEFRCSECGCSFTELYRKMTSSEEGSTPACPECGSADTARAVTSFAVHGPSGPDAQEVAAEKAQQQKLASITPKEQIDKWRSAKKDNK